MKAWKHQHTTGLTAVEYTLLPYRGKTGATISLGVKEVALWLERCQFESLDCLGKCEWGRWCNTVSYHRAVEQG